jgi:archaellum component FlaG (FlaF/FlaG flagellin family)
LWSRGDYSVRVSVTGTDSEGATVTSETYVEGMIKIEEANPDFDFTEVSPGRDSYVDGEDYQVDAIILVKNTGNVPLYSFDYEVKLLDADGSVVATDTGTRETSSGPLVEPGEEDQVTASFLTDDIPAGVYSTQITVTGKDEDGNPVVNEMYVEDMINIEGSNRDFEFTEISPGRDGYVDGEDYQVDAIILLKNTGNVPLYSFDYKVELLDADGSVVATDTGTRETSSGPLVEPGGEDQVTGSFLTDDIPPGDYSVRVSVTGKDSEGGIVTHEEFIEDMIKIAEKPDQTTGIPGFPVASMAAGLAAAMLLQHLSRSRRG